MNKNSKIYVAGHTGMVGSAIVRCLEKNGFTNIISRSREGLDLTRQKSVEAFFSSEKPDYVFLAAAKVGGIYANNTFPADFIYQNLVIESNIIHSSYLAGVKKLLFLGSSCIYPRDCPQPIKEEFLLTGPLEKTNEAYAIAKIGGIKMCEAYRRQFGSNFISAMPTNLYGPGDNYDLAMAHVVPALIRKFHENLPDKPVTVWGTGSPRREFLYVEDLGDACVFLMQKYDKKEPINVGCGKDLTIKELSLLIQKIIGHKGSIIWDSSKPDGTPQKLLDVSKIESLGWKARTKLSEGLLLAYSDFRNDETYQH
jgi:GDP-L-fucose synthase